MEAAACGPDQDLQRPPDLGAGQWAHGTSARIHLPRGSPESRISFHLNTDASARPASTPRATRALGRSRARGNEGQTGERSHRMENGETRENQSFPEGQRARGGARGCGGPRRAAEGGRQHSETRPRWRRGRVVLCTGDRLQHGDILPLTKSKYQPLPSQNHSREPGLRRDEAGADGQLVQKPRAQRVDAKFSFLTHVHS